MNPLTDMPIASFVSWIAGGPPFAFSRWGDGEWRAILGYDGENCDGHPYTGALRADLSRVLSAIPSYLLGMQPFAMRQLGGAIETWLERRSLHLAWLNADVFHQASIDDRLGPLIQALAAKPLILIGPSYLEDLRLFPRAIYVPAADRNCYASYAQTLALARSAYRPGVLVAVSAGMMGKLLVNQLHADDPTRTIIDFGSLWDPYAGKATRRYHRAILDRLAVCA